MPIEALIILLIIVSSIIAGAIWSIIQWRRNNAQSAISIEARVVSIDDRECGLFVFRRSGGLNLTPHYRITFELIPNGKKKTFEILTIEFSMGKMVAVGDVGTLTLQGTRFISFKQSNKASD